MPKSPLSALLLLVLVAAPACAGEADEPGAGVAESPRVVAIGDLHGDLDNALATLRLAGIIDDSGAWAAGTTTLVQTGDVTDRGPDSKQLLDLLWRLQDEAKAAGGQVLPLLGNHEVMNLQGDLRYVHPGDFDTFGGKDARSKAFSAQGDYGRRMATMNIAATAGDAVFVHGGIRPEWAAGGLDALNERGRKGYFDSGAAIIGETGPLWYRGYANNDESTACVTLRDALDKLGVKRMVVGHTTQRTGKIATRCGGRLHLIDVGIAAHYGGNLAAWEWSKGDARAIYPSGPVDLEDPT